MKEVNKWNLKLLLSKKLPGMDRSKTVKVRSGSNSLGAHAWKMVEGRRRDDDESEDHELQMEHQRRGNGKTSCEMARKISPAGAQADGHNATC